MTAPSQHMVTRLNPHFNWGKNHVQFHGLVPQAVASSVPASPTTSCVSSAVPTSAIARGFVHEYVHYLQSLVCPMGIRALARDVLRDLDGQP